MEMIRNNRIILSSTHGSFKLLLCSDYSQNFVNVKLIKIKYMKIEMIMENIHPNLLNRCRSSTNGG
jgi:hypothetical protein